MTDIIFPAGGTLALRARVLTYEVQPLQPGETPAARFIEDGLVVVRDGIIRAVGEASGRGQSFAT